ncbi:OmpA family protein [Flavobacteriaceae bacterium MHTCC 0001]
MKLKIYALITLVFATSISTSAQQGLQKKADSLFNKFAFVDAAKAYKKLIKKNYNADYATRQLADCYTFMRNTDSAAVYYSKVVQQENAPIEYYYKYAQALRGQKDYKTSRSWLKRFKDANGFIEKNKLSRDANFINTVFNAKSKYSLKDVKINSELSDFGAFEHDGKVYFASTADKGVLSKHLYAWNKQPFLDIYVAEKSADTIIHHKSKLSGKVNSRYHDGPAIITKDGNTMYFSRNNYNAYELKKDKNGINNLAIYKASLVDGEWTNIEVLPFVNADYSFGHPNLNSDETKLYFTSDMSGGYGGTDIYYVDITDGSYGTPQNVGNIVNTKNNEVFPFINSEDVLFFSSDGHLGLGLLDIFATTYDENGAIEDVVNLGVPVNSNKDDFSFFMNDNGTTGYIASNRPGGKGDDDIYAYNRIPNLKLQGVVKDSESGLPVPNAVVKLFDNNGLEIAYVTTDENGEYSINIDRDADYKMTSNKEGFDENSLSVTSKGIPNDSKSIVVNFTMSPTPKEIVEIEEKNDDVITLPVIYFDYDSSSVRYVDFGKLDDVVVILNTYPDLKIKIESHTDSKGPSAYNERLSQERAYATFKYLVSKGINKERITEFNGYGESRLTNGCDDTTECTDAQHRQNRRSNFITVRLD